MVFLKKQYEEEFKIFYNEFRKANDQIKIIEYEKIKFAIPPVKQLRDIAYHLAFAIDTKDDKQIISHLQKAYNHARRAKYDTYEIRITYYLQSIKLFIENFASCTEILDVIPDYHHKLTEVEKIKTSFFSNIQDKEFNREEYYLNITNEIDTLRTIYLNFEKSKPMISKKISYNRNKEKIRLEEKKEQAKKDTRNFILTVIGLIGTFLSIYVATK